VDHPFRFNKRDFDGNEEHGLPPPLVTRTIVLEQTRYLNVTLGKPRKDMEKKRKGNTSGGWEKKGAYSLTYLIGNITFCAIT
jgi:hypothetical protein